jgi:hypothetical protein
MQAFLERRVNIQKFKVNIIAMPIEESSNNGRVLPNTISFRCLSEDNYVDKT